MALGGQTGKEPRFKGRSLRRVPTFSRLKLLLGRQHVGGPAAAFGGGSAPVTRIISCRGFGDVTVNIFPAEALKLRNLEHVHTSDPVRPEL